MIPWRRLLFIFLVSALASFVVTFTVSKLTADGSSQGTDYGSGAAGGPVGTQVLSTQSYTAISDWMIVGDSITVRGYKAIAATHPDKRLAVNAWSGRNTKLAVDQIVNPSITPFIPKRLVMATGTNDIFAPFVMQYETKRLLNYVNQKFPDTEIYWVDVQASRPGYTVADQRNSMIVNQAIWQNCTQQTHCTVISWAGFLAANPGRLVWYIDSGGVHQTMPSGNNARAALIGGAVRF